MIRIVLPFHLRNLAGVDDEIVLDLDGASPVTLRDAFDALEALYPVLRGTIRAHVTQERRPFVRFFADEQDLSLLSQDVPLPPAVTSGEQPLLVVGAIAGG